MAECSLAVTFSTLNQGLTVDTVDSDHLCYDHVALPMRSSLSQKTSQRYNTYVDCGAPLPDFQVEIRNGNGERLPERSLGTVFVRGPSVMSGYFGDSDATRETLSIDGWLNTGDLGYHVGDRLIITGRQKDLIIINGRNVWPQDLEYLAEQQPEVRPGDAIAFAAPDLEGKDTTILVVQCRETDPIKRADLVSRLRRLVRVEIGVACSVELAPLHTLPRTSSGKLSRSRARSNYMKTQQHQAIDLGARIPAEGVMS
jgi:fatty-acyl-CoA synthase